MYLPYFIITFVIIILVYYFWHNNSFPFKIIEFNKISYTQFQELCSSKEPVLFKNTITVLPTFDEICNKLSNKEMKVRSGDYGTVSGRKDRKFHKETMKETCNNIKNDSSNYGGNNVLTSSEIKKIGIKSNNKDIELFDRAKLWIGPRNSRTPLHKDAPKNLALQLYGNKTWRFFNSNDNDNLCFTDNNKSLEWSQYEIGELSTCPSAKKAFMYEIKMTPGDMLYLPEQWSHDVKNNDISIMINYWY